MLNQADSFLMAKLWTQTDEVQGTGNLQTHVVCCNIQPQAKGKMKHLHVGKAVTSGTHIATSLICHKYTPSPGTLSFPRSPDWEMLRKSLRYVGERGWKNRTKKKAKNTQQEEACEKERTGEFNQSKKVLQHQASSGVLEKWTWDTSCGQEQKWDTKEELVCMTSPPSSFFVRENPTWKPDQ